MRAKSDERPVAPTLPDDTAPEEKPSNGQEHAEMDATHQPGMDATQQVAADMDAHLVAPVDANKASAAERALKEFMANENLAREVTGLEDAAVVSTNVDTMWDEVSEVMNAPTCRKCKMPCSVDKLVNKSKGEQRVHVVCRPCNSATTMLSRHLGSWPIPSFQGLSPDQQVAFWKRCDEIIQKQGKLDYGSIRAFLAISLAERQYEVAKAEFVSEYLPLSVWAKRGYDPDDVKKGLKEIHPVLGDTYAIPLKTVTKGFYKEKMEEMLTKFEADARKKKGGKVDVVATSASAANGGPHVEEVKDDDDLLPLTWLQEKSPRRKRSASEMEDAEVRETNEPEDPKAQRRIAAELKRHNTQVQKTAQKGLDALNPLLGTMVKWQANFDILPAKSVEELRAVGSEMEDMVMNCRDGLKVPDAGERLQALPFDAKSLGQKIKQFKTAFANCDRLVKIINKAKK
eukprot:g23677.t1